MGILQLLTAAVSGTGYSQAHGPGFDKINEIIAALNPILDANIKVTAEGGYAIKVLNKTGAESVKGELVTTSPAADNAVALTIAADPNAIGVFYDSGVADGDYVWVVVGGIADVMLKNNTASTHGYWVKVSDTAGRADATTTSPPLGGVAELDVHMTEVGHCLQSQLAGTNVLARCVIHFN